MERELTDSLSIIDELYGNEIKEIIDIIEKKFAICDYKHERGQNNIVFMFNNDFYEQVVLIVVLNEVKRRYLENGKWSNIFYEIEGAKIKFTFYFPR
jgi:hypothetical protein